MIQSHLTILKQNPAPVRRTRVASISGAVGATALILASACTPAGDDQPAAAAPAPAWKQTFKPVPTKVEIAQDAAKPKAVEPAPAPVAAPTPPKVELAIAHDDEGVDYDAKARALMDAGELKAALVAVRKHLHAHEPKPEVLLVMGRLARQTKNYALAEAALERGLDEDPSRVGLANELARVFLAAGQPKRAEKAARRALRITRDDASAWNQLARAVMAQSRWELAEVAFGRAVHLDPVDGLIQNNFGLLYVYRKNGPKAVEHLERAVELLDDAAPYYVFNNLGLAHELVGQHEEAREAFEEALLLNPFYTKAKVNLDRVAAKIAAVEPPAEPAASVAPAAFEPAAVLPPEPSVVEPDDA